MTAVVVATLRAGHLAPAVAVTAIATALAAAGDVAPLRVAVLAMAVFTGQLVVGWTNDLIDTDRDRRVGRTDKPLVAGTVRSRSVLAAAMVSGTVCVATSLACGVAAGLVHLILGVGSALAYNVWLKGSVFSWAPYAVAFGALPVAVALASRDPHLPHWWLVVVAALIGVGAHLVNVLPDLEDDADVGIRGFPHRLGRRRIPVVAAVLLVGATALGLLAAGPTWWRWVALGTVLIVAAATVRAPGRIPFYGVMGIAAVDVAIVISGR